MFKKSIPKNWKKSQKKAEKLLSASIFEYFVKNEPTVIYYLPQVPSIMLINSNN